MPSPAKIISSHTPSYDADPLPRDVFPDEDNFWHLLYTTPGYSDTGTLSAYGVQHGDQSSGDPQEENGIYTDNTNKIVLLNQGVDCVNTGPSSTNACTFAEEAGAQLDDHNIRYHFKNWGGRCYLSIRFMVYPPAAIPNWSQWTPWAVGSTFIVFVPEIAVSATVFGKLAGQNIFFTPSDPLSTADQKHFTLTNKKVVPQYGTIYTFSAR